MSYLPEGHLLELVDLLRNGENAKPVPLIDDSTEPVLVGRHLQQAGLLYEDLKIGERSAKGEIGPWYAKHFFTYIEDDEMVRSILHDKDCVRRVPRIFRGHPVILLFEHSKLTKFLNANGVPAIETLDIPQSLEELRKLTANFSVQEINTDVKDMSSEVLDGRLGEVCQRQMSAWPIALAWPALVTVAGVLMPEETLPTRTNLYCALVGPAGCGKSIAVERAIEILGVQKPILLPNKIGSAEGLAVEIGDKGNEHRLFFPGELRHTFLKANIEGASFDSVLNDGYYNNQQNMRIARQKEIGFSCQLSFIGGMVEETFGELFGRVGGTGLYDRFIFGQCPTGTMVSYRPFDGVMGQYQPTAVRIDPDVWETKDQWIKQKEINHRIAEHALRAAAICAGFDGRAVLRADDLKPALAFAQYQQRVRLLLQPNPGENFEGKVAHLFLAYLDRHAPDGQWVRRRSMFKATNAYKYGPSIGDRALKALAFNGELEINGEETQVRRLK